MKIIQINTTCTRGSTGKICFDISNFLTQNGVENYIICSGDKSDLPNVFTISTKFYYKIQALFSKTFGNYGFNSYIATVRIIRILKSIKPDIVHLHNIHSHDCNLQMLLRFLAENRIKVCWTFHDCWAFTGYCTHFLKAKCDKWEKQCLSCPQFREYSWLFDKSDKLYRKKKRAIENLDLTIITPSIWLKRIVLRSFAKKKDTRVINNGVDLQVFHPYDLSAFDRFEIPKDRFIILGVAYDWGERKGLDVFIELSNRLNPSKYQIVLVGVNDVLKSKLPETIMSIDKTDNQDELAQLYSMADVFFNPTREDTFPTVNMESLACGTPVMTFDTGGSPEIIDEECGCIVADDIDIIESRILGLQKKNSDVIEKCVNRAVNLYNRKVMIEKYMNLYKEILKE